MLILLIRFGSGLLYSHVTPAWESYDEPYHFAYAIQIATTGTLPQNSDPVPNNERIQPPAYYLLLATFLKLTGSDVSAFQYPERNPYFFYGTSGLNYALHPQTLSPGEQQVEKALEASRWLSLLLSLVGVAFTYRAARVIWPKTPHLALVATALFALWPQGIFNSSVITNDGPAMAWGALLTWAVLYLAIGKFQGGRSLKVGLLCVLGVGVGLLIKINLLAFMLPLVLMALVSASTRVIVAVFAAGVAVMAVTVEALQRLPQVLVPFLAIRGSGAIVDLFKRFQEPGSLPFVQHALEYAINSTFGLFGWGNVSIPDWLQQVWMIVVGVGILGVIWLVIAGRWARYTKVPTARQWLVIGSIPLTLLGGGVALALSYSSIHLVPGRYLLPGLAAFSFLVVAGWSALPRQMLCRMIIGGAIGGLTLLSVLIPVFVVAPAYFHLPYVNAADIPNRMNVGLAPGIDLVGYDVPTALIYPGDTASVDLYFMASFPLLTDYTVQIVVVGPDGQGHGILNSFPGNGNYPTTMWAVNQPFRDHYIVPVQTDFPAPAVAHFRVRLLPADSKYSSVDFGTQAIHARTSPSPSLPASQSATFGPGLLLRGVSLKLNDPAATPRMLTADLTREAITRLSDRKVYVHLQNDQTRAVLAQQDQPPRAGTFPLSWWLSGEIVADHYVLTLPSDLPVGKYPLRVGLYDPLTGERWTGILPGQCICWYWTAHWLLTWMPMRRVA